MLVLALHVYAILELHSYFTQYTGSFHEKRQFILDREQGLSASKAQRLLALF